MHRIPDTEFIKTPTYKVLTLTRDSRPTTRFVNVGSAFMNARELAKRQVDSQRKSRMHARHRLEKRPSRKARVLARIKARLLKKANRRKEAKLLKKARLSKKE